MSESADKLAQSRLAIIEFLHHKEQGYTETRPVRSFRTSTESTASGGSLRQKIGGWLARLKQAVSVWWRGHPGHAAVELATPYLSSYGRRAPAKFLGIAGAIGMLLVVIKPWKLLSITGVLAALFKSTQLSTFLMSALSAATYRYQRPHDLAGTKR